MLQCGTDILQTTFVSFFGVSVLYKFNLTPTVGRLNLYTANVMHVPQGRIQDLIRGGGPDRDRPKTAILGPQFCRILVLGPHFWWSGGGPGPRPPPPPWIRPCT